MGEQTLVVGVDGSPASYTALRWALVYAGRTGARVRAVHCWMPIVMRGWEAAVSAESGPLPAVQVARAQRQLAEIVSAALIRVPKCAAGVDLEQKVLRGPAGPGLVCSAIGADLLVVGHGPRVAELLHRSVSWYCVRHAHCPVLVIPPVMTRRKLTPAAAEAPR